MADRHEVLPHHLLRALLDDRFVRDVLAELAADADAVRLTLDHHWLAASDVIEAEEVAAVGIDLPTVLTALTPPFEGGPEWHGRTLAESTRDVLVLALREQSLAGSQRIGAGHVLLGLMGSRDRLVTATFADHGLRLRAVRPVVRRWGRRAV